MSSLVVRCPKCATAFRVVADQLRVRDGLVRCSVCQTVFDGRAAAQPVHETSPASERRDSGPQTQQVPASQAPATRASEPGAPASQTSAPAAPLAPARPAQVPAPQPTSKAPASAPPSSSRESYEPFVGINAGRDEGRSPPAAAPTRPFAPPLRNRQAQARSEPSLQPETNAPRPEPSSRREPYSAPVAGRASQQESYTAHLGSTARQAMDDGHPEELAGREVYKGRPEPSMQPQADDDWSERWQTDDIGRSAQEQDIESDETGVSDASAERRRTHRRRSRRRSSHEPYAEARYTEPRYRDRRYESVGHDDDTGSFTANRPAAPISNAFSWRRRRQSRAMQVVWRTGVLVGLLTLLFQVAWWWRTPIATHMPIARPALEAMCQAFGCTVGYVRAPQYLTIESSSVQPQAINDGQSRTERFMLEAVLRNRAPHPQPWPTLELSFTDHSDTVVVRRGLQPNEYLPSNALAGPFPPNAERRVAVELESQQGVPVSGYRLSLYFP